MFRWISSNSCPLHLLLVRSHQAEIIIVKRLIQGRNNVTRVRVEPRLIDQGRRKNDAFTLLGTLPTIIITWFCCTGIFSPVDLSSLKPVDLQNIKKTRLYSKFLISSGNVSKVNKTPIFFNTSFHTCKVAAKVYDSVKVIDLVFLWFFVALVIYRRLFHYFILSFLKILKTSDSF